MKKKWIALISATLLSIPVPVYATALPDMPEEIIAETETETTDKTTETEEIQDIEETHEQEPAEGDEMEIIEAVNTRESSETPNQINLTASLPEHFGLSVHGVITNTDTGVSYNLPLYDINGYTQRCFVSDGSYQVVEITVYDDSTGKYIFEIPEGFSVTGGQAVDLNTKLLNEDEIVAEIESKLIPETTEEEEEISLPEEKNEYTVESDYEVTHNGNGTGEIGITGFPNAEYNIVIKIVKGGILGTAEIQYSVDGGLSWSLATPIPLSASIPLEYTENENVKETGLTAVFNVNPLNQDNGFVLDDTYLCYVADPNTSIEITHDGKGIAEMQLIAINPTEHAYDLLEAHGQSIIVKILRDGAAGTAVLIYSIDGGSTYSDEMYVPEDGEVLFDEIGLKAVFLDSDKPTAFVADDVYTAVAERKSYRGAVIFGIVLIVIALSLLFVFVQSMKKKIPGYGAYHIQTYTPHEKPQIPSKKAKKEKKT